MPGRRPATHSGLHSAARLRHIAAHADEIGEVESGRVELATQRAQDAPAGACFARQLAGGNGALCRGRRGWSAWHRLRACADRQDHVGNRTVDAHANC
jgi:hypothetical protein